MSVKLIKIIKEWLPIVFLIVLINIFFARAGIKGRSMFPTIADSDNVFMTRVVMNYKRGDIVFYKKNGQHYISRVIGLPGETIEINKNNILINNNILEENYLGTKDVSKTCEKSNFCGSLNLPHDSYYLLGDNREITQDSLKFGPIKSSELIGKAYLSVHNLFKWQLMKTPNYVVRSDENKINN